MQQLLKMGDRTLQNLLDAVSSGLLRVAKLPARAAGRPKLLAALVSVLGAGLLLAGLALIYPPAAFIAAGTGLLVIGLLPDYERTRGRRR